MSSLTVAPAALAHLEPLDGLVLPAHLSGERGRNRAQGLPQVAANDDRSAVLAWLARYKDSPATLASYRKEAERLLAETGWLPEPLRLIDDAEAPTPEVEAGGEDDDAALPAFLAGDDEVVTAEATDDGAHLVAAE